MTVEFLDARALPISAVRDWESPGQAMVYWIKDCKQAECLRALFIPYPAGSRDLLREIDNTPTVAPSRGKI